MIWFSWSVSEAGYEARDGALLARSPPKVRAVVCLKDDFAEKICLDFIALDASPESITNFANQYGLLKIYMKNNRQIIFKVISNLTFWG